jgi:hypothetical protein
MENFEPKASWPRSSDKPIVLHSFDIETKSGADFTCVFAIDALHDRCLTRIVQSSVPPHKKVTDLNHALPSTSQSAKYNRFYDWRIETYTIKMRISFSFRFTFRIMVSNPMVSPILYHDEKFATDFSFDLFSTSLGFRRFLRTLKLGL